MARPRVRASSGFELLMPAVRDWFPKEWSAWELARHIRRLAILLPRCALVADKDAKVIESFNGISALAIELIDDVDVRDRLQGDLTSFGDRLTLWLMREERAEELDDFGNAIGQARLEQEDDVWPDLLQSASRHSDCLKTDLKLIINEILNALPAETRVDYRIAEQLFLATTAPEPRSWTDVVRWGASTSRRVARHRRLPSPLPPIGEVRPVKSSAELSEERLALLRRAWEVVPQVGELWHCELKRRWESGPLAPEQLPEWHDKLVTKTYLTRVVDAYWSGLEQNAGVKIPRITIIQEPPGVRIDEKWYSLTYPQACFLSILSRPGTAWTLKAITKQLKLAKRDGNASRIYGEFKPNVRRIISKQRGIYALRGLLVSNDD